MRVLSIDFGEKRIGLAISDEGESIAFEVGIIPADVFFSELPGIVLAREVEKIVVGLPLNMSGDRTVKTEEAQEFYRRVQELLPDIPCELMDERLSSVMAQRISGSTKGIDGLAAQIFLQNYLNKNNAKTNQNQDQNEIIT
jgi:putative Holliday junction resolvase